MSFLQKLESLNFEELLTLFQKLPQDGEDPFLYYSEVAASIGTKGEEGIKFLYKQIKKADTPRLVGIIFALSQEQQDSIELLNMLCGYLNDQRAMVVAEAIDGLRRLGAQDCVNKILGLRSSPSPYVRGSVLRFMARLYPEKAINILIEALNDQDFIVRENAADELGELEVVSAIPLLRPLLADSHPDVRSAAQTAIEMLQCSIA